MTAEMQGRKKESNEETWEERCTDGSTSYFVQC